MEIGKPGAYKSLFTDEYNMNVKAGFVPGQFVPANGKYWTKHELSELSQHCMVWIEMELLGPHKKNDTKYGRYEFEYPVEHDALTWMDVPRVPEVTQQEKDLIEREVVLKESWDQYESMK